MADYDDEFENASDTEDNSRQSSKAPAPANAAAKAPVVAVAPVPVPVAVKAVPIPIPTAIPAPISVVSPKSEADRAVEAALDSGMWKRQYDAGSQKHYYFHVLTKATTWNLAEELGFGDKRKPTLSVGLGSDTGSTIVSPQENPILLKLPAKFRSNSMFGDEPSRSKSPELDEESTPGVKDAGGGKQFQHLARFHAFGSVSPAGGDEAGDDVKADSLTSSPTAARSDTQRAAAAREGFRQAVTKETSNDNARDRPSVSFAFGAGSESAVSDPREDPAEGKGAFGDFNAFRAFNSGDDHSAAGSASVAGVAGADKSQSSRFLVAAKQATKEPTKNEKEKEKHSDDSSSAFSTASQAIAKRVVTPATAEPAKVADPRAGEIDVPQPAPSSQRRAPLTLQTANVFPLSPNAGTPVLSPAPVASAAQPLNAPKPSVFTAPPFSTYVVPATRSDDPQQGPLSVHALAPDRGFGAASVASLAPQATMVDSKLIELRETTEAVERLVRAFAHLRGVEPSQSAAERAASFVAEAGARGLHHTQFRPQKTAGRTLTTSDDRTFGNDLKSNRRLAEQQLHMLHSGDRGDLGIHRMHEEMLESVIVDCVLDMMTNDFQRRLVPKKRSTTASATQPYPSRAAALDTMHETVTIDQYRRFTDPHSDASVKGRTWKQSATSGLTRHDPYHVFESPFTTWRSAHGSSAMGEGELSLATLAHEALNKYVLRHLVLGTLSPPLVRLMLVDLMSACMDAALRCFGTDDLSPATVPMVLLRFDGAEKDIPLATQICHALPLEVIDAPPSAGGVAEPSASSRRRVFRVEHWVCRIHMLTIVKALQSALRQAEAIDADSYRTFRASRHPTQVGKKRSPRSNDLLDDAEVFIPQERCLFSVFSEPDNAPTASGDLTTPSSKAPIHVSPQLREAIEAPLTSIVDDVAATLLGHPAFDPRESDYVTNVDQQQCTIETMTELLQDPDIRKALEKRASQKLLARALKRKEDNINGSAERQGERNRREEQLRILREAEDRASKMVDEIRAEMAESQRQAKR